jgi:hypothetical protein
MALDLSREALNARIDALRGGWAGWHSKVYERNKALLKAFSPEYDHRLGDFDQWIEPILPSDEGHARSSYNVERPVAELWAALEFDALPPIRWQEAYIPPPPPSIDERENAVRQTVYKAQRQVAGAITTMREQPILRHTRLCKLAYHDFRATVRKNIFGHSWTKLWPDTKRRRFRMVHKIDPSTVYPVWSDADDTELEAVLVAYRKSAQSMAAKYPEAEIKLKRDGVTVESGGYYTPTNEPTSDGDRAFVWVEDYWTIDETYEAQTLEGDPVRSLVVNGLRVNGKMVRRNEFPGWTRLPYFHHQNDNERDALGFSDVGTMMPVQEAINKFMSAQQDVIGGEARPRFKFRGDADREIEMPPEGVIPLERDEDIEQIQVHLDVFPTQLHGNQLFELMARASGLTDPVWGKIAANSNSGRALAMAWRAVAARMVPRRYDNTRTLMDQLTFMLDCMELYDWENARELYQGNRDFEPEWSNQEPRDFTEVTLDAVNKLTNGMVDLKGAMELTGEQSPDDMRERVKADYLDEVLHPEKAQSYRLLAQMDQQMALQAQQAEIEAASAGAQIAAQQVAAVQQARTQAAQQAAPTLPPGQAAPATAPGAAANPGQAETQVGTLVQNGAPAQNRIIVNRKF